MSDAKELVRAARERGALEGEQLAWGEVEDYLKNLNCTRDQLQDYARHKLFTLDAAIRTIDGLNDPAQDAELKAERDAALDEREPVDVDRPANPITGNRSVSEGWQG